jgi:hypothetical protein
VHIDYISGILLAGMPASNKGRWRAPLGDFPRSGACGEASAPIGSLAEQELSTKICEVLRDWEERQPYDGGPATAKKRRTDLESNVSIEKEALLQIVENVVAKAC